MKAAPVVILALGLLAAGCDPDGGQGTTAPTTPPATTTIPGSSLDPDAPAQNRDAMGWDGIVEGQTWVGQVWRATAGGPVEVSYLGAEGCEGWAPVGPEVEYTLPAGGGRWAFSFGPEVPVVSGAPASQDVPPGLVLIVRGPDGRWLCRGEYHDWQYFPGPGMELADAPPGTYDVWVAVPVEGDSIGGTLVIMTDTPPPSTTTTIEGTEASTFPSTSSP